MLVSGHPQGGVRLLFARDPKLGWFRLDPGKRWLVVFWRIERSGDQGDLRKLALEGELRK